MPYCMVITAYYMVGFTYYMVSITYYMVLHRILYGPASHTIWSGVAYYMVSVASGTGVGL